MRREVVGVALIIALLAALVAVVVTGPRRADNPLARRTKTRPETPVDVSDQSELEAAVQDLTGFVERERGLRFREPVEVELLDGAAFEARLLEDFEEEDAPELRKVGELLQAFAILEEGADLPELFAGVLGLAVVGFYDPETGELVVRGGEVTPYVRETIVHELTHALDDQHYELHRPQYERAQDEIGFGFSALVEGNARRVEQAYHDALSASERVESLAEQAERATDALSELRNVPFLIASMLEAPYVEGPELVEALLAGGEDELAAAFAEPPTTSEQVLDPDRYLDREPAMAVPHPTAEGRIIDQGVLGQLFLELLLASDIDRATAESAAQGWGGDWVVWWQAGDTSCARLAIVGDTAEDTDELERALRSWANDHPDASVSGDAPVTITACA
jgi:hypothetical protein